MSQQAALERQALEQLRRGDLRGARGTLTMVAQLRPDDVRIRRRLEQVDALIAKREDARTRMEAEPLQYAHAYIKAGRLEEGLRLLRAALAKDPENARLRELALEVARRIKRDEVPWSSPASPSEPAGEERRPLSAGRPGSFAAKGPARSPTGAAFGSPDRPAASDLGTGPGRAASLEQVLARVRTRRRAPSRWLPASERRE